MENKIKKREEIPDNFKWDMSDVYRDESLLQKDVDKVKTAIAKIAECQNMCENKESFKESMKLIYETEFLVDKIYFYSNQKYYENLGNPKYQKMSGEAQSLLGEYVAGTSFVTPMLLAQSEEKIMGYVDSDSELEEFRIYLKEMFRQKQHVLSDKEEAILAKTQKFSGGASEIFSVFNNVDLDFPMVLNNQGVETQLSHGNFHTFITSENRKVRKDAFDAMYHTFAKYKNTLAAIYINSLKKDAFYAEVRKYRSSREMFLDDSSIPEEVYDNLIETVNQSIPLLQRYLRLRKKVMKVDELHLYDVYVPMVNSVSKNIPYEKALEMVAEGLKPMGEEYGQILQEGFENHWIDVYENQGKRSGAYSWSVYGTHPYVLLNYQPVLNSVFTIAHEMGHAIHSYYSNNNQNYVNSQYKIFVAEVASTCNETLLILDLIAKSTDDKEKAYLINYFLEQFRTTLFRQTMFAEFEQIVHKAADEGEALNSETLCQIYYELNKKYFGDEMCVDQEIEMEWARIPHFYTAFYVYQYATGFSAAVALAKKILKEGEPAVEDYKKFLKSGCSDTPIELLKIAGVDMSKKEPVELAMKMFEELLDEFERSTDK